jgi:CheY-like chemotaxis protein
MSPVLAEETVPVRQQAMEEGDPHAGGLRILVADDNHDAATTLSILLELDGHRTRVVHNGLDALLEATRQRYDAVLLDLGMPIMDGFQAAAALGRLQPAPVLIACSAWDDAGTRRRAFDRGFAMHLRKPVELDLLRRALSRVWAAARRRSGSG